MELTAKSSSIKKDVSYIPDILPEYLSVWMTYTNDGDSNFAVFEEQYRDNELTLHDAYLSYLQELKTLEEFKTKVDQLELELEHVIRWMFGVHLFVTFCLGETVGVYVHGQG